MDSGWMGATQETAVACPSALVAVLTKTPGVWLGASRSCACPWTIPSEAHPAAAAVSATTAGLKMNFLNFLFLWSLSGGHALGPVVENFLHPQPPEFCSPCIWKDNDTTLGRTFCYRPWPWPVYAALPHASTSICVTRAVLAALQGWFSALSVPWFASWLALWKLDLAQRKQQDILQSSPAASCALGLYCWLLWPAVAWRELETAAWFWYSPCIHPFPVCGPSALASSVETAHVVSPPHFLSTFWQLEAKQAHLLSFPSAWFKAVLMFSGGTAQQPQPGGGLSGK